MYLVVEIHSRDSGRAIFAGHNQGSCMARRHGRAPTMRYHATVTEVSAVWVVARGNVRSCPHCRRLCSPTLGGEKRGRPGEHGSQFESINYWTLAACGGAAIVCRLLVTSKGNDAYRPFSNFEQNLNSCKRTPNVLKNGI